MNSENNEFEDKSMPVIFFGHGSPMNSISENVYTKGFNELGAKLPKPKAILAISAHWMTKGSWVTHMDAPKTIHDFYGFPERLFQVQYPAPGSPDLAEKVQELDLESEIKLDDNKWGLDHGTWSVLKHMFPKADVPVIQLSLDLKKPLEYHFELGKKLKELRTQGVLIIGSGNVVHNISQVKWDDNSTPYD
ncbi:MAG: 4,5-DOPA dioxygenase extradiol, partial [Bdellovibrionales bacterium]|nr:4,5-DOPA dioxygenase extradiol [Bdellovibrionales bacterium]